VTTRRRFLSTSTAALAAPFILTSRNAVADALGRTIRLGHIGVGGQGSGLLQNFLSVPGATSIAIADPFRERREAAA
jgi:predicted homoserine dehydrogenase-like protein